MTYNQISVFEDFALLESLRKKINVIHEVRDQYRSVSDSISEIEDILFENKIQVENRIKERIK